MKRRDFLKSSVAAPFVANVRGANDRIVIAQIGLGGRGKYEISVCENLPGVRLAAICDVYQPLVDSTAGMLDHRVDGYQDFRRILDRKDIDAVFISTADHWHGPICIMASQAGKDSYVEKPLAHTIQEGQRMVEAARKYNRVVQTGSQQRSAEHYLQCVELIQRGYIGKVTFVDCWNSFNTYPDGMGNPLDSDPPSGLDWDMFLGPAPNRPYNQNRFVFNWRWFWDYGCGLMTDWGAHHFDIIHWALGVNAPLTAVSTGDKYCLRDNSETPDTFSMDLEYPGFLARYTVRYCNGRRYENRSYGISFHGTKGTLVVDRGSYEVIPEMGFENAPPPSNAIEASLATRLSAMPGSKRPELLVPSRPGQAAKALGEPIQKWGIRIDPECQIAHIQNWLDCIRSRKKPVADVELGHRVATACHLGVISYKLGRTVKWDAGKEVFVNDAEAQSLTTKQYRAPWALPEV
jgi:predicted dehydrogenase